MDSIVQEAWMFQLRILNATGFVPMKNKPFYLTLLAIWFSIFTWIPVFSMLTKLFLNLQDVEMVTQICWLGTTQFSYVVKLVFFIRNNKNIQVMQEFIEDPLFNDISLEQEKKLKKILDQCYFVARCFRINILISAVFFFLKGFDPAKVLLQPGWFPFDERKFFYEIFTYQYISVVTLGFVSSSIDILTYTVWSIGIVQFRLIADNIKNLGQIISNSNENEMEVKVEVKKKLRTCISHHIKLLKYLKLTEETFSVGIFTLFFFSVLIACLTGFIMITLPKNSNEFINLVLYFCATMYQVFCYCWFGNSVMLSSSEIADGCYESSWYDFDTDTAKSLAIIMARSQVSLKIRAMRFVYISLPTFVSIMRSSYSYFAMLQRLYGDS